MSAPAANVSAAPANSVDAGNATATAAPAAAPSTARALWQKALTVAWMSILLGVSIELLLLLGAALTAKFPARAAIVADLSQKISWAVFVCVGLALGTAAAKARPAVMGLLGLVSAPLAFVGAKAVHKGALQALGMIGPAAGGPAMLIAGLKAAEYATLGVVLGHFGRKGHGLKTYLLCGLAAGLTFGVAIILALGKGSTSLSAATLVSRSINEVLFPMGCSLVLYAADVVAKQRPAG